MLNKLSTIPWRHVGQWRYSSTILKCNTKWRWLVSFISLLLYPQGNRPWYPLDWKLKGLQSQLGCCGEEKMSLALVGIEPCFLDCAAHRLVAGHHTDWAVPDPLISSPYLGLNIIQNYLISELKFNLCIVLNVGWASTYPEPEDKRTIVEAAMYNHNYDCPLPAVYPWPELPTLKNVKIQKTSKASSREI